MLDYFSKLAIRSIVSSTVKLSRIPHSFSATISVTWHAFHGSMLRMITEAMNTGA